MENLLRPLWRVCFAKAKGGLPIDFDFYITARDIHSAAKFAEAWYESVGAGEDGDSLTIPYINKIEMITDSVTIGDD